MIQASWERATQVSKEAEQRRFNPSVDSKFRDQHFDLYKCQYVE